MSRGREPVGGVLNGLDAGRVRAVLLMSGMPWDELDDGLQQVRLKVLEQQGEIRDLAAWTAVVATRTALDWHRLRARDSRLHERMADRWSRRSPADHPQEHVVLALTVAEGLERLPKAQRQALVLRYYADLSVPTIARLLDVPEGTVKSRIHGAVATLRRELRDIRGTEA